MQRFTTNMHPSSQWLRTVTQVNRWVRSPSSCGGSNGMFASLNPVKFQFAMGKNSITKEVLICDAEVTEGGDH